MKLDKDAIWIGGIGVILYLLASKGQNGSDSSLPSAELPDGSGRPQGRPAGGGKKPSGKKPQAGKKPAGRGQTGGESSVEMAARRAALEKLKEVYGASGYNAFSAANLAKQVYREAGGDISFDSPFMQELDSLQQIDAPFSHTAPKVSEYDEFIATYNKNIEDLTRLRTQQGVERDKAMAVKAEIDKTSWFESPMPEKIKKMNDAIDALTAEIERNKRQIKKDQESKTHLLAIIQVVRTLNQLAGK